MWLGTKLVFKKFIFCRWYNGYNPDLEINLTDISSVCIIGQGNVALDVARIFSKSYEELKDTEIASYALEALKNSNIQEVNVLGRRGHIQTAFTMKEIRELNVLENAKMIVYPDDIERGLNDASLHEALESRACAKKKKFFNDISQEFEKDNEKHPKNLKMRFLVSPYQILGDDDSNSNTVGYLSLKRNELSGEPFKQVAVSTDETILLKCGMVISSVGYKGEAMEGVPFDETKSVIPNKNGRVLQKPVDTKNNKTNQEEFVEGLYCTGWLKRGPKGVIGTNIGDSQDTLVSLLEDFGDSLPHLPDTRLEDILDKKFVNFEEFMKIDAAEIENRRRGSNAPRERFSEAEMLKFLDKKQNNQ
eukprot:TRINITY_DN43981_c0_g1_i1.p1 TRINITY_DN43981_c0_g1~~TRINITY_DN43981_c0_g1_i1.p1  ORF type:complete len:361 (-),score=78.30 TRINITY_DN43981_c0_g1_i1:76-1158(-)